MKEILYICNNVRFLKSHRMPLLVAVKEMGYKVHVAASDRVLDEDLLNLGVDYHRIPLKRGGTNPFKDIVLFFKIFSLLRHIKPDLVHNVTAKPVLYGSIAARILGLPTVNAISGLGYLFTEGKDGARKILIRSLVMTLYKLACNRKNTITILQNSYDLDLFLRENLVQQDGYCMIRGSGVDLQLFYPCEKPRSNAKVKVVLAARMIRDKGIFEFIEAVKILKAKSINAEFILAGGLDKDNPTGIEESLLRQWQDQGLITWKGNVKNMPKVYVGADIVCLPSYREGVPKVLLEAGAMGLPSVVSDIPGCREVIKNEVNGLLVEVFDAAALAEALQRLITDEPLRERLSKNSRKIIEDSFSLKFVVENHLAIYKKLAGTDM